MRWCCRRDLNSRPLPYQGSALPLSYGSAGPVLLNGERPRCGGRCARSRSGAYMPERLRWRKAGVRSSVRSGAGLASCETCGARPPDRAKIGFNVSEPPSKPAKAQTVKTQTSKTPTASAGADSAQMPKRGRPVKSSSLDRRAEALRDNLRRRKAQSRSREASDDGESRDGT